MLLAVCRSTNIIEEIPSPFSVASFCYRENAAGVFLVILTFIIHNSIGEIVFSISILF